MKLLTETVQTSFWQVSFLYWYVKHGKTPEVAGKPLEVLPMVASQYLPHPDQSLKHLHPLHPLSMAAVEQSARFKVGCFKSCQRGAQAEPRSFWKRYIDATLAATVP